MSIFRSIDPATGEIVWEGEAADAVACAGAVTRARAAFPGWAATPVEERAAIARRYAEALKVDAEELAVTISRETGELLWESRAEVAAMMGKVEISITAQAERAGTRGRPERRRRRAATFRRPRVRQVPMRQFDRRGNLRADACRPRYPLLTEPS